LILHPLVSSLIDPCRTSVYSLLLLQATT